MRHKRPKRVEQWFQQWTSLVTETPKLWKNLLKFYPLTHVSARQASQNRNLLNKPKTKQTARQAIVYQVSCLIRCVISATTQSEHLVNTACLDFESAADPVLPTIDNKLRDVCNCHNNHNNSPPLGESQSFGMIFEKSGWTTLMMVTKISAS